MRPVTYSEYDALSLRVDGADNPDAAWYYPDPKPEAERIRGRIASWKSVEVG